MRKIIISLMVTLLVSILMGLSSYAGINKLTYDGKEHEYNTLPIFLQINGKDVEAPMPPIVFGEHSLVPAREVFEALGAKVTWNDKSKIAIIAYEKTKIYLTIDEEEANVFDGEKFHYEKLDMPAKIINDKTMIPTRFVSELLGFEVEWDESKRTILLANKVESVKILDIKYVNNPASDLIKNVAYTPTNSRVVQVDILSNSPIEDFSTHFVKEPYRLVVDIQNSILTLTNKNIPVDENGISQIRMSQFQLNPDQTRVVIDLDKPVKYKVYLSSDKKHLKVDFFVNDIINTSTIDSNTNTKPKDTTISNELDDGKYIVVIDPGHGGGEPGATYEGVYEKDLNLDIALRVKKLLEKEDINVIMTREDNSTVDLMERAPFSNSKKPDLFISIHNNAATDTSLGGTMTLYNPEKSPAFSNVEFAKIMQKAILNKIGTTDKNIRERPGLAVLKYSDYPSVLVEIAFMSNKLDMLRLKNDGFKQSAAEGIRDGIVQSLNAKSK